MPISLMNEGTCIYLSDPCHPKEQRHKIEMLSHNLNYRLYLLTENDHQQWLQHVLKSDIDHDVSEQRVFTFLGNSMPVSPLVTYSGLIYMGPVYV